MNLLDRYIYDLSQRLPQKGSADVLREIRSTLEDMIEERSGKDQHAADDALIRDVLIEFGSPQKVADEYLPHRYLIGPGLYPVFMRVMKIGLVLMVMISLVFSALNLAGAAGSIPVEQAISALITDVLGNLIGFFGNIVLIFAILERTLPQSSSRREKTWDPEKLPKYEEKSRYSFSDSISEIVMCSVMLVLLNIFPKGIGIFRLSSGKLIEQQAFMSDFFISCLPWVNTFLILMIALHIWLLIQGRWTKIARIFNIALDSALVILGLVLISGPALIRVESVEWAAQLGSDFGWIAEFLMRFPEIAISIAVFFGLVDVYKGIVRFIQAERVSEA